MMLNFMEGRWLLWQLHLGETPVSHLVVNLGSLLVKKGWQSGEAGASLGKSEENQSHKDKVGEMVR